MRPTTTIEAIAQQLPQELPQTRKIENINLTITYNQTKTTYDPKSLIAANTTLNTVTPKDITISIYAQPTEYPNDISIIGTIELAEQIKVQELVSHNGPTTLAYIEYCDPQLIEIITALINQLVDEHVKEELKRADEYFIYLETALETDYHADYDH